MILSTHTQNTKVWFFLGQFLRHLRKGNAFVLSLKSSARGAEDNTSDFSAPMWTELELPEQGEHSPNSYKSTLEDACSRTLMRENKHEWIISDQ